MRDTWIPGLDPRNAVMQSDTHLYFLLIGLMVNLQLTGLALMNLALKRWALQINSL